MITFQGKKYYTSKDVSRLLQVTPETIRRYMKTGKLVSTKIANKYYTTEDEIKKLLKP